MTYSKTKRTSNFDYVYVLLLSYGEENSKLKGWFDEWLDHDAGLL